MDKHGQAIGGIKSQMKILREQAKAGDRTAERLSDRIEAVERHADKLRFRITLLLVSVGVLFATLIIGFLLK